MIIDGNVAVIISVAGGAWSHRPWPCSNTLFPLDSNSSLKQRGESTPVYDNSFFLSGFMITVSEATWMQCHGIARMTLQNFEPREFLLC